MTNLELTDEETAALLRELDHIIDADRYPFSSRIRTLTAIRDKLRPPPVHEPAPAPKTYAQPRAGRYRRRGWITHRIGSARDPIRCVPPAVQFGAKAAGQRRDGDIRNQRSGIRDPAAPPGSAAMVTGPTKRSALEMPYRRLTTA